MSDLQGENESVSEVASFGAARSPSASRVKSFRLSPKRFQTAAALATAPASYEPREGDCVVATVWLRHAPKAYANGKSPSGDAPFDPPIVEVAPEAWTRAIRSVCATISRFTSQDAKIDTFISSPYRRAHQTFLGIHRAYCAEMRIAGTEMNVTCDPRFGEYLGNQAAPTAFPPCPEGTKECGPIARLLGVAQPKTPSATAIKDASSYAAAWTRNTIVRAHGSAVHLPPFGESIAALRRRCADVARDVALRRPITERYVAVVVTHGLVAQTCAREAVRALEGVGVAVTGATPQYPSELSGIALGVVWRDGAPIRAAIENF